MEKPSLDTAKAGAMRFNTDSRQLEIYDGNQWTGILGTSSEQQTGGTRGLWFGGEAPTSPAPTNRIQFVNVDSTGNATDFGDLLSRRTRFVGATASPTRALFAGGNSPSQDNVIQHVEILSTGDAIDFGDLSTAASFGATGGTISTGHGGL